MKNLFFRALAAGLLVSYSAAIHLSKRAASPAVVRLGTQRKAVHNPVKRDALRRRQTVTETLDNRVSSHSRIHIFSKSGSIRRCCRSSCAKIGLEVQIRCWMTPLRFWYFSVLAVHTITASTSPDHLTAHTSDICWLTSLNQATLYYANVSLGAPTQNLRLHIDTGSCDLWANVKSSEIAQTEGVLVRKEEPIMPTTRVPTTL